MHSTTIAMLACMLAAGMLLRPLAARLHLPFAALLVAIGFAGSELVVALGYDTGIRHDTYHDLIVFVFLPLLVYAAAFRIDRALLRRNLAGILALAVPILLLTMASAAVLIYVGIGHAAGFPWIAALLTAAVLIATDAAPLTERFPALGVPRRLGMLLDGQDLFNDAIAIVAFGVFLQIATNPGTAPGPVAAAGYFVFVFLGGVLVGLAVGMAFMRLMARTADFVQQALLSLLSAYAAYLLASTLGTSGVIAVLVTGLMAGRQIDDGTLPTSDDFVRHFWQFNAEVATAVVFLLMGVTVTLSMFAERWLAMLIGIAAILLARALGIFAFTPLINRLPGIEPIPPAHQRVLFLGSLRGAVVLALALSLPTELPYWWTIQSIAFGVVIFGLFVQAPVVEPVLRRDGLTDHEES